MNNLWRHSDLDEEQLKAIFIESERFRGALSRLIEHEVRSMERTRDYDENNWAFREADRKGQIAALERIQRLITKE